MPDAVLLSAHGSVERDEDVPAFLSNIRRGRRAAPELVREVQRRLGVIGGSPLRRITEAQAAALSRATGLRVEVGMRLWTPTLEAALRKLAGATRILSLPAAPQSVHVYHSAVRAAAERLRKEGVSLPPIVEAPPWGDEPALLDGFCAAIDRGLSRFAGPDRRDVAVVLSAHSLPRAVIASGDPYETQFRAMAEAVIARRGDAGAREYAIAFQSQGADGGDWIGPDLPATFAALAAKGRRRVLVAAIGFLTDHIETLYDLDIEAKTLAAAAGLLEVHRAPSLDADERLVAAMADVTRRCLP